MGKKPGDVAAVATVKDVSVAVNVESKVETWSN